MMETNSVLSNRGGASLSADEIFTALDGSGQHVVATGGTTDYVATPSTPITALVDGLRIFVKFPTTPAPSATLNVSGLGAKALFVITKYPNARVNQLGDFLALPTYEFRYYDQGAGYWMSSGMHCLNKDDIPSMLNATTFGGDVILAKGVNTDYSSLLRAAANDYLISLCGGSAIGGVYGAYMQMWGNGHYSTPGDAKYYTGSASGAAHSFFDKNGVEQLRVNENGLSFGNLVASAETIYRVNNLGSTKIYGGTDSTSARLELWGASGTYPGAHQQFAPLSTRAASTAFAVCPVATGDIAEAKIMSNAVASCWVFVDASGTVTLYDSKGGTVSASIVNSSSPAAGEIGIYVSAGVLYCKPGSSFTGKIATFSKIGKA